MWPPDFANRLSLIKCLYSSEKTPPPQKNPLVFRTMTFQKVSPSVGFSPIEFSSSRVYGRSRHRYSPVCVDLWAGSLPGWQSTVKLLSWLLCFSVCTKYLSLSGGSRSEGRDGAFDFPVFAVLGRPLPALLELALK